MIRCNPLKPAAWGDWWSLGHNAYRSQNALSLNPAFLNAGPLEACKGLANKVLAWTGGKKTPLLMIHYPYGQFLVGGCIRGDAPKVAWELGLRKAVDGWADAVAWLKANACGQVVHYFGDFFGFPEMDGLLNPDGSPTAAWFDRAESSVLFSILAGVDAIALDSSGRQSPTSPTYQFILRLIDRGVTVLTEPCPFPEEGQHLNGLPTIRNADDLHKSGADADLAARPQNYPAYQLMYFNNSFDKDESDVLLAANVDKKERCRAKIQEIIDLGQTPVFRVNWDRGMGAAQTGLKLTDLKFK